MPTALRRPCRCGRTADGDALRYPATIPVPASAGLATSSRSWLRALWGTAIALRLGHRVSIDFDFFSDRDLDRATLIKAMPFLAEAITLQDETDAWTVLTSSNESREPPVKVSLFSGLGFGRVGVPFLDDKGDLLLASLDDLLGHKLKVLLQRVESKDYMDVAALLAAGHDLEKGLGAAMSLFKNFPPFEALKALVYFDDANLLTLPDEARVILLDHVSRCMTPTSTPIVSQRLDGSST